MRRQDHGARRLVRARRRLLLAASLLSGAMLIALTAVTVLDVVGRYLFNSPLNGAAELTEFLLIGVIFIGIPAITLGDEHLTVDLLTEQLRGKAEVIRKGVVQIIVLAFFALAGWQVLEHADRLALYGEATTYLGVPYAPIARGAGGLLLLSALVIAWQMFARIFGRKGKEVS